jgi:hypothetical protein
VRRRNDQIGKRVRSLLVLVVESGFQERKRRSGCFLAVGRDARRIPSKVRERLLRVYGRRKDGLGRPSVVGGALPKSSLHCRGRGVGCSCHGG